MERLCVQGMCYEGDLENHMVAAKCERCYPVLITKDAIPGQEYKLAVKAMECQAYRNPEAWHRKGGCPLNTIPSKKAADEAAAKKKKLNPLKASKRARR